MNIDDRLVFWGVFLFFLSLLTGLLLVESPSFVANPRGVLAGHVEAAMNGMFVTIVGLFFHRVTLSVPQARICRCAALQRLRELALHDARRYPRRERSDTDRGGRSPRCCGR